MNSFQEVYEGIRQTKLAPLPVIKANEWYPTQSFSSSLELENDCVGYQNANI